MAMKNTYLFLSVLTSLFIPCIVFNPKSKFIFVTSSISTVCHSILLAILLSIAHQMPEWLNTKLEPSVYQNLLPIMLLSNVFAWILHLYSDEEFRSVTLMAILKNKVLLWFFISGILLSWSDVLSDILTVVDHFRYLNTNVLTLVFIRTQNLGSHPYMHSVIIL